MSEHISKLDRKLSVEICHKDFVVNSDSTFVYISDEGGVLKVVYKGDVQKLLSMVVERIPPINIFK
ncbi:hypothetical protein CH06BL_21340 [Chromobacterium haemolyticum]|nr:hypothetical protein CH06BL_21340 [Chromobacterium haemolyticum]